MDLPSQRDVARLQLSQVAASYIRELIMSGRARTGDFLRIDSIAKAMSISSTPVREGLLLLQTEGFVRLVPRRGFMVVGFSRQDVRDIFWGQAVLAGELAARAAKLITQDQLAEIADLMEAHRAAVASDDEPLYTRLGHRFHRAINVAARSPRLAILLGGMTKQLPNSLYGKMEGQIKGSLNYHPRIYRALKVRDVEAARTLMHKHIVSGGEILVKHLEELAIWQDSGGAPRRRASSAAAS